MALPFQDFGDFRRILVQIYKAVFDGHFELTFDWWFCRVVVFDTFLPLSSSVVLAPTPDWVCHRGVVGTDTGTGTSSDLFKAVNAVLARVLKAACQSLQLSGNILRKWNWGSWGGVVSTPYITCLIGRRSSPAAAQLRSQTPFNILGFAQSRPKKPFNGLRPWQGSCCREWKWTISSSMRDDCFALQANKLLPPLLMQKSAWKIWRKCCSSLALSDEFLCITIWSGSAHSDQRSSWVWHGH